MTVLLLVGILVVCAGLPLAAIGFVLALLGIVRRKKPPTRQTERSVKDQVVQAQREYDLFWRKRG